MHKASSTVITEFLCRACRKVSLKIIQAGFEKRSTFNALGGTKDNIYGAEAAYQASKADDFSGSSDVGAACDIDWQDLVDELMVNKSVMFNVFRKKKNKKTGQPIF